MVCHSVDDPLEDTESPLLDNHVKSRSSHSVDDPLEDTERFKRALDVYL